VIGDNVVNHPNYTVKSLDSIQFDISRFGMYTKTIHFSSKKSPREAILAVEKVLNKNLTDTWYNNVRDDVFHDDRNYYDIRADCIGDAMFIELIQMNNDGSAYIRTGS